MVPNNQNGTVVVLRPPQQAKVAAQIYKGYGRWSTVCSAIVCWALIAAE